MGVTTVYDGCIKIKGIVPCELFDYINNFSGIRHMKRDNSKIKEIYPNYKDNILDYTLGCEGEYFVINKVDDSVICPNEPPKTQPGIWCQWVLEGEKCSDGYQGVKIVWDRNEKFYNGYDWMKYIIKNFIAKKGFVCNGVISGIDDYGNTKYIIVVDNKVYFYNDMLLAYETHRCEIINLAFFLKDSYKLQEIQKKWMWE